jgi:hypothetical protein
VSNLNPLAPSAYGRTQGPPAGTRKVRDGALMPNEAELPPRVSRRRQQHFEVAAATALVLESHLEQLRADLAQTQGGRELKGALVRPFAEGLKLSQVAGALVGFSVYETGGISPARLIFRDGVDTNGTLVCVVTLGPGESVRDYFGSEGLGFSSGLFVDVQLGAVDGAGYLQGST